MATLVEYFKRQSNKANWSYSDQLCGPDGNPLWDTAPGDLVITLVLRDKNGVNQITIATNDGSGQLAADDGGMMNVNVIPNTLGALYEGMYDIWLKIVTDDFTIERAYGRLPICEGI